MSNPPAVQRRVVVLSAAEPSLRMTADRNSDVERRGQSAGVSS